MLVFPPVSQEQLIGKAVLAEVSYSEVISNKRNGVTQPTYVSGPFQWLKNIPLYSE